MEKNKKIIKELLLCVVILTAVIVFLSKQSQPTKNEYYDTQVKAALKMHQCMDAVKEYKKALGVQLSPHEYFDTGMLGDEFNFLTTSIGELSAKRTTANPDMAALMVKMFYQAGLENGDKIGVGFSGSFPSMNIAVLAAAEVMEIEIVVISSVGASTYGANNIEISFPEMLHKLYLDGIIKTDSSLVTLGGDYDIGVNLDPELLENTAKRIENLGFTIYKEKDLEKNIQQRMAIYAQIDCFVAVGGNITSAGTAQTAITLGQGVLKQGDEYFAINEKSGLIQRYMSKNTPVINILNIKKIVADYGMPFDPVKKPMIGRGSIYFKVSYSKLAILLALILAGMFIWDIRKIQKGGDNNEKNTDKKD